MSFRDEYKKELGSISPDSEKIIKGVHERLDENAPIKIRIERKKKKSVFAYIGSFAGAAACLALFMTVLFVVAPNFVKNDGAATNEGTNGGEECLMGGNPAAPGDGYNDDDTADETHKNESNKPNPGIWGGSDSALSTDANKAEGVISESSETIDLKIIGGSISDAREVIFNGEEYYRTAVVKKEFDEIPESLSVVRFSDEVYYVLVDGDRIFIAEDKWVVNEKPYCFKREWTAGESSSEETGYSETKLEVGMKYEDVLSLNTDCFSYQNYLFFTNKEGNNVVCKFSKAMLLEEFVEFPPAEPSEKAFVHIREGMTVFDVVKTVGLPLRSAGYETLDFRCLDRTVYRINWDTDMNVIDIEAVGYTVSYS